MALVIAHRTCPRHAPENSLEGVARAAEMGADAVEMDVRVNREGVPVLLHDGLLWRTASVPLPIRWAGPAMTGLARRRGRAPSLADALEAARARGLRPVLDVKARAAAPAVLRLLEACVGGRVSLWSQHAQVVAAFVREGGLGDDVALLRDTSSVPERERLLRDAERLGVGAVVNPSPGHPRWIWAGSDAPMGCPPIEKPYTHSLVATSGSRVPASTPR